MAKYPVTIIQVFRVERSITVEVEAGSQEEAIELQSAEDAPAYDDPHWVENRTLENEEFAQGETAYAVYERTGDERLRTVM